MANHELDRLPQTPEITKVRALLQASRSKSIKSIMMWLHLIRLHQCTVATIAQRVDSLPILIKSGEVISPLLIIKAMASTSSKGQEAITLSTLGRREPGTRITD